MPGALWVGLHKYLRRGITRVSSILLFVTAVNKLLQLVDLLQRQLSQLIEYIWSILFSSQHPERMVFGRNGFFVRLPHQNIIAVPKFYLQINAK